MSYLAAPAFAAAMIGRQVLATIPVRRRVLLLAELPVGEDSALEHQTVSAVNRDHEIRLLAVARTGDQVLWRPSDGRPLRSTDRLLVVRHPGRAEPPAGRDARPGRAETATPYRLLEPWECPTGRAGLHRTARRASSVWAGRRRLDTTGMMMPVENQ